MRVFKAFRLTVTTAPAMALAAVASFCVFVAPAFAVKEYVPGISFGEPCGASETPCGAGKFNEPMGMAVNDSTEPLTEPAAGDVYVVDRGDNRVERFTSVGVFQGQFDGGSEFEVEPGVTKATPALPQPLEAPEYVAVDDSGKTALEDPSVGDVYVTDNGHHAIDRFSPTGENLGQLTGTCPAENESQAAGKCVPSGVAVTPFGELFGIAVGTAGEVWVHDNAGNFDEFTDNGVYTTRFHARGPQPGGLALDSEGDIYATFSEAREVIELSPSGQQKSKFVEGGVSGLAVATLTDDVLVDKASGLELYGPFVEETGHALIQTFATESLSESYGLAVNSAAASQTAYASKRAADDVRAFNYVLFPTVTAPSASEISNTEETLSGTVEPEGEAITECRVEYGLVKAELGHYEHSVLCAQAPKSITGVSAQVSQAVSGLLPGATYHFRVDTSNANGTGSSADTTFTAFPTVGGDSISDVGSSSAVLHAAIAPGGIPTSYFFEYGLTTEYGLRTPVESAGASSGTVEVSASLEGLSPDTIYHYRLAADAKGTTLGPDGSFSTFPLAISGLPDGRGYELVSPLENGYAEVVSGTRSAADGSAVAYQGQAPEQGGNGNNSGPNETGVSVIGSNEYLASRSPAGWMARDIQPEGLNTATYVAFSSGLSVGILDSEEAVTTGGPNGVGGGEGPTGLYTREAGGYQLLGENASYAGSTPDGSHVLLEKGHELYEMADGTLSPVNVLPGGGLAPNASFGGPPSTGPDLSDVISEDGSRVFWSEEEPVKQKPLRLFVSEGVGGPGERTVQLDAAELGCVPCTAGGGLFWTASSDGSTVFFTDEKPLTADSNATAGAPDLYEYDLDAGTLTDLTPAVNNAGEHADVVGVLGASSDGSYVYFAAAGSLAGTGATPQKCVPATEEGEPPNNNCNVYALHEGEAPRLVATVTAVDGETGRANFAESGALGGDWVHTVGHASFVSEDGRVLVFKSIEDLTGFDSLGDQEIYSYEYGGRLTCVSCNPSGAPTIHGTFPYETGAVLPEHGGGLFATRDVSANGDRVFFETAEALVSQDSNGKTDVYEWERDGTGSCMRADGCLYLLSGGTSSHNSHFVDASENGNDVFFISDAELVPADSGEYTQLYDARVGAIEALAQTACIGTGCQGVPPAPPLFATPSSVTFAGAGNFEPQPATKAAMPSCTSSSGTPSSRCGRRENLAKALAVCKRRYARSRKVRKGCEAAARRKYAQKRNVRSRARR